MESDQSQSPKSSGGGNFLSGMMFGAIAGAVGYFLFGTEKGKQAREKLSEEWKNAKDQFVEDGVIVPPESIPQTVQKVIEHVIEPQKVTSTKKTATKKKKN